MVSYENWFSGDGTVSIETPFGKKEMTVAQLVNLGKGCDLLFATAYVLRPFNIKAFGWDERARVVYAAAENSGTKFTFAAIAPYYSKEPLVSGYSMESEADGSDRRNCPLCVLEQLSPLAEYPWSDSGKRWSKEWRKACLKRILRSRKASDADKAVAYKLMTELDEQPRLF